MTFRDNRRMRALAGMVLAALYWGGVDVAAASPVYNGGPVLTAPVDMNFIWYGAWTGNTATVILPRLIDDLNGSTYMHTLSSFVSPATSQVPTETANMSGNYFIDSSSSVTLWKGAALDGTVGATGAASIQSIVAAVIGTNGLTDPSALYFVLTAPTISVSGFGTQFCGWHNTTSSGSVLATQFGFIGAPAGFGSGCDASVQRSAGINGNFAADAMASVIAHELIETITDPTGFSWWDSVSPQGNGNTGGFENSDMCNFRFGATHSLGGANYNVVLNGDKYLLQQQWINDTSAGANHLNNNGGQCGLSVAFNTAAPEPSALPLLSLGIFGLRWLRRRRAGSGIRTGMA